MECGGRGGGGTVMRNLPSSCLVLRVFGVPRKSPRAGLKTVLAEVLVQ